ncbi:hypothetical protein BCR33DRAFT_789988 [Rhizoclosmatium globosum]|uniref:Cyclic nucleotide-binding domain-containing protein n=1 Tax=Rhizoclosmatium globosum TaxID=329046 RepID=A0A1Y2BPZ2_9FUNG|nr:hypothetical protein BCR33DRAFT_789988 [Rhizoclosmatium globosum]|eukprot:ORY36820.1 hypothetical protein BCR33DRAFT_789988 [Rhizoclosmatium globosum]
MKDATNEKTVADLKAQIKLPSKPPPKLNLSRSQTQNRSIQKKSIRSKLFEKNGSMSSIDSNDEPSGLYPSLDGDLPKHSYRGLNAKKKAVEVEERHIVNINNDEEHDGDSSISSRSSSPKLRTYKSNMSIATTDIPRYTFAPMKNEGSTFYLNDTRNLPGKSPKPALARSYSALHAVMKRDRVDKPVSEFDPQNKNTVAMQAERSRRASKAFSILPGTRRTSSSNNRRDSSAIRKQSLAPSTATPQTPNYTIASASSIHRSFISVLAPAQDPIQLSLYQRFLCLIILPAYDNKGRKLTLDQFDEADFDAISFVVNGFHPKSYFVTLWDFLISLVYGAALWIIPFLTSYVSQLSTEFVAQCSFWFTLLFAIDSIIYLITPQPVVVNPMGSFREYESMRPALFDWLVDWLRGSLIFEVASLIPFEMIFHGVDNYIFFFWLRFLRFYRVPDKLSRCAYFTKAKLMLEKQMGMGFCKVIPIALLIFYFIHFNACAMYLTGSHSDFMGWTTTWPQFNPTEVYNVYTWTFFQAVGNIFPMSFKPQTAMEQAFAIVFIVIGAVLYAAFVGYVSSAAMSINPSGRLYNQKMEELIDYVKWKNLSKQTKEKLVSYYETKYRGKFFEEDTLLQDMNESLREEISMHNTQTLIEKVPFLQRNELDGRDEIFFRRIATVLHARYFIPGDYIIKQGDSGNEMYFILSGKVNVYVNGVKVVSLYDGAYLGGWFDHANNMSDSFHRGIIDNKAPSNSNSASSATCVLYKLTRHDFHTVINEFPDMRIRIDKLAREAERMVKQAEDAKS